MRGNLLIMKEVTTGIHNDRIAIYDQGIET